MEAFDIELSEKFTIETIEALPEGVRAELIDGEIYYMASPTRTHQRILMELAYMIMTYIKEKGGPCEVEMAPFAVYLENDRYNYVEPDLCVICDPEKLDDKGCHGAPDWMIEIVSPSSQKMDYMLKHEKYQKAGVREYWIIDPEEQKITVYNYGQETHSEYDFTATVKTGIYEDLTIDFKEIAAMLA